MKIKLLLPIIFISLMLPLLFFGCDYGGDDDNVYIPNYQDAIYIMDADGSNKQKSRLMWMGVAMCSLFPTQTNCFIWLITVFIQ